jgi:hypothetical protein
LKSDASPKERLHILLLAGVGWIKLQCWPLVYTTYCNEYCNEYYSGTLMHIWMGHSVYLSWHTHRHILLDHSLTFYHIKKLNVIASLVSVTSCQRKSTVSSYVAPRSPIEVHWHCSKTYVNICCSTQGHILDCTIHSDHWDNLLSNIHIKYFSLLWVFNDLDV